MPSQFTIFCIGSGLLNRNQRSLHKIVMIESLVESDTQGQRNFLNFFYFENIVFNWIKNNKINNYLELLVEIIERKLFAYIDIKQPQYKPHTLPRRVCGLY